MVVFNVELVLASVGILSRSPYKSLSFSSLDDVACKEENRDRENSQKPTTTEECKESLELKLISMIVFCIRALHQSSLM
jgi:hypothetical protein